MTPSTEASTARTSVADRYRVLLDIGKTLTGMLSREDLYRAIYRETARVLEADGFYISLYDQESDLATVVFSQIGEKIGALRSASRARTARSSAADRASWSKIGRTRRY